MNKFFKTLGRDYPNSYLAIMDNKLIEIHRNYHTPIKITEADKEQIDSLLWIWTSNPSQFEEITLEEFEDRAEIKEAAHEAFMEKMAGTFASKEEYEKANAQLQKDHPLWD